MMASTGITQAQMAEIQAFKSGVIERSADTLVVLDFWAEWCGPCKALLPVLEKVADDYADRGVALAKINVDEQKLIADQFQIRSIPTVYAISKGKIVANLTEHRSEGQLTRVLDTLIKQHEIGQHSPKAII